MLIKTTRLFAIFACALFPLLTAFAQQNQPQNKQEEPNWVEISGFKGQIFDIKNRDPRDLVQILKPLGSGFKGTLMQPNGEYKTITVRDFPENIATIGEAIKRLDVPLPPKPPQPPQPVTPDVEVFVYVLIASNNESAGGAHPPVLADVIKQLQATLNYKSYQLLAPIVHRTRYDNGAIEARGTADLPDKSLSGKYELKVGNIFPENRHSESSRINLGTLNFYMEGFKDLETRPVALGDARISTRLSVRDGEKVVVGTASLRDKAVILVLTTKVIK
jgi:type II/III secretion system protein